MKNILKRLFTSKKKRQEQLDRQYAELDRILRQKRLEQEHARAVAVKEAHPVVASKKTPVKNISVKVTKVESTTTDKKPTAKKPAPKKK
jgi:hypothetical protein